MRDKSPCSVSTPGSLLRSRTLWRKLSGLLRLPGKGNIKANVCSFKHVLSRNDELIQNCISEAEKHSEEIAELENRTALHIEYAQEKQIEIQNLEVIIDTYKNKSQDFLSRETDFQKNVTLLEDRLISKDALITRLKDDIVKLEESFGKEEKKKHEKIEQLNERLENASLEVANNKIKINDLIIEHQIKVDGYEAIVRGKEEELSDSKKRIEKLRQEKLNLLKIVQQLADLSNPSLSFTGTVEDFYDTDDNEIEQSNNNTNTKSCCDNSSEFANYDVSEEENFVNEFADDNNQEVSAEEEGSTSFENIAESLETKDELM